MRMRNESTGDTGPRKLALAERNQRDADQQRRLVGIDFTGPRQCSHQLIDLVVKLYDQNHLEYVRWNQCTTRDQELMGIKTDPVWKADAHGVVREHKPAHQQLADLSTDLLLRNALTRRALAFDNCRLTTFSCWEAWHETMLDAYLEAPPTGYRKT